VQLRPHSLFPDNTMFGYLILKWRLKGIGYHLSRTGETMCPFKVENLGNSNDVALYPTLEMIEYDFGL
jgi:hypothetical protein